MAYHDILIPDLGAQAVETALKQTLDKNESLFRGNREQLVDFYYSQQTDKDEYLKDFFNSETDSMKDADYPHNLILSQANITAKVINKKAKNYITQPVRLIDGKQNSEYESALEVAGIKTSSKLMDRLTWLLGDQCVVIIADKDSEKLRIENPPYFRPIFENGKNLDPVGVIYPIGLVKNKKGESVEGWQYWDEESAVLFENGTWNIINEEENTHGCFNAIFPHRTKPCRGFWTQDAQDLIDGNRDINIAITSINNAMRIQGFPNLIFLGVDPKEVSKIKIRWDKAIGATADVDGKIVDAKYLYPNVDWLGLVNTIKFRIELIALTWNVDIKWDLGGNMASGVALKVLSIDDLDDRNEMSEMYEEYFEVPLFQKIQIISKNISWMDPIKGTKLTLDWPDEHEYISPQDQATKLESDIRLNITNPVKEIQRRNPDLDDDAAMKEYLKNKEVNSLINKLLTPTDKIGELIAKRNAQKTMDSLMPEQTQ